MKEARLFVHRTPEGKLTVRLEPTSPSYPPPSPSSYYRVSPIFKARPELMGDIDHAGEVTFAFYILDRAYRVVSELNARARQVMPYLWFSHGLASIIVISGDTSVIDAVDAVVAPWQIASEKWIVLGGEVAKQTPMFPEMPPLELRDYDVVDYSTLPEDQCTIVQEFVHSLNKAVWLSNLFMPSELRTYKMLRLAANDMIAELVALQSSRATLPELSAQLMESDLREDHLARRKAIHQLVDRIVQINSALSYLMSQSFAGVVPILQRECLIRNYSLLGVGTAVAGVAALARHIERVFEKTPVDMVIEQEFSHQDKLHGWSNLATYDVEAWDEPQHGVDEFLSRIPVSPHLPKLVYFSGRLGFREAEFSVSAALQVLSAANTVAWSLMTLTHELLHGHVRELMSSILINGDNPATLASFRVAYSDYQTELNRRSERRITQLDSIRFILFHYCEQVSVFGSLSRPPRFSAAEGGLPRGDNPKLSAESARDILEAEYRNISEIMVHVLDFYYFYNAQPEIYLPFVWESWSEVPAVLKNIPHYLLRSVVTVASALPGTIPERYRAGVAMVKEQVIDALHRNPTNELLREALNVISETKRTAEMQLQFYPSVLIADLTAKILRARSLHAALLGDDPNLDVGPDGFVYRIRTETFIDDDVASPTAFLLGLLSEALNTSTLTASQRTSAWVFLALASSTSLRGGGPNVC